MKKYTYLFLSIVVIATAVWLSGCGEDECPVCPPEPEHVPDYHMLFSYVSYGSDNYVMIYSTKSGKAIDSLHYRGNPFDNMLFSHDGSYACFTSIYNSRIGNSETWVTAWPSHDTVAHLLGTGALAAYLTPDDRYLFLTGGRLVAILTFPDLGIVFRDSTDRRWGDGSSGSASSWAGALHPSERLAYVTIEPYWDSIFVLDYAQLPVAITSFQLKDRQGMVRTSRGPLACTERQLIFVVPNRIGPSYLGVYDPTTVSLLADRSDLRPARVFGGPLSMDGKSAILAWNGGMDNPTGGIDFYGIETDVYRSFVAEGEISIAPEPFVPSIIELSPDGESMFVMLGADGFWLGSILQIDISNKEVEKRWTFTNGFSRLIRINTRDVSEP